MKALVVYDSFFGNTEQIARAIGQALGPSEDVTVLRVGDVKPEQMAGLDMLIVGSPTRAFRPTPAISRLLGKIPRNGLEGVRAAAFDTRISLQDVKSRMLSFLVKMFGYAAEPMAKKLRGRKAELAVAPEGFFVKDTEGPLKEGEIERATEWARQISAT